MSLVDDCAEYQDGFTKEELLLHNIAVHLQENQPEVTLEKIVEIVKNIEEVFNDD
jgi:hypothetical protein